MDYVEGVSFNDFPDIQHGCHHVSLPLSSVNSYDFSKTKNFLKKDVDLVMEDTLKFEILCSHIDSPGELLSVCLAVCLFYRNFEFLTPRRT